MRAVPLVVGVLLLALPAQVLAAGGWRNSLRPSGLPAGPLPLARSGQTDYVIVIPAQPTSQERKAAEDLAQWLGEMTGAQFPIVSDAAPAAAREISVGRTNRLTAARLPQARADLGDEGYALGVAGERLFLLGGAKRGPIYAVYAFLEEDLGCRWYAGEGSTLPRRRTLVCRPVPRAYRPPLLIRDPFYHDAFNATWSLRNRTNAPGAPVPEEWGGHVDYDGMFVHTFNTLLPPDRYFKEHPEYYSLLEGERRPVQLCLTNPEVVRLAAAHVLGVLAQNPHAEIISVSPNDGGRHCQCPGCSKLDRENGSPAGSLISFVNQVAAAVERQHPGVWISTLAYLDTVDPPRRVRPRRNVAIQLCNDLHSWRYPLVDFAASSFPESRRYRQAIIGWSRICRNLHIWDYTVNFSHYLAPMPNLQVLAPSVRFYREHHVTGIMFQGNYQSLGGERTPLRTWVMAKLLWDPSRRVEDLVADFTWGYYREAAPALTAYYDLLDRAGREQGSAINEHGGGIRYPMTTPFLSRDFLTQAAVLLDQALTLARSPEIRRRVELERLALVYVKLCQGPQAWGDEYPALLDHFEAVARRERITHLEEGPPDLEHKLATWRQALRVHQELPAVGKGEVTVLPLPARWRFAPDPAGVGEQQGWAAPGCADSGWAWLRTDQGTGWESQGFPDYAGAGWYRLALDLSPALDRPQLYLYFAAVDEEAWVYLDGRLVHEFTCAGTGLPPEITWRTPFSFDLRPHLPVGRRQASLAVRIYNRVGMGGIYQPVYLVAADRPLDATLVRAVVEREVGGK